MAVCVAKISYNFDLKVVVNSVKSCTRRFGLDYGGYHQWWFFFRRPLSTEVRGNDFT